MCALCSSDERTFRMCVCVNAVSWARGKRISTEFEQCEYASAWPTHITFNKTFFVPFLWLDFFLSAKRIEWREKEWKWQKKTVWIRRIRNTSFSIICHFLLWRFRIFHSVWKRPFVFICSIHRALDNSINIVQRQHTKHTHPHKPYSISSVLKAKLVHTTQTLNEFEFTVTTSWRTKWIMFFKLNSAIARSWCRCCWPSHFCFLSSNMGSPSVPYTVRTTHKLKHLWLNKYYEIGDLSSHSVKNVPTEISSEARYQLTFAYAVEISVARHQRSSRQMAQLESNWPREETACDFCSFLM